MTLASTRHTVVVMSTAHKRHGTHISHFAFHIPHSITININFMSFPRNQSLHEQTSRHFGDRSTRDGRRREEEKTQNPSRSPKPTPCVQSCMATAAMRLHHLLLLLQHPPAFCPVLAAWQAWLPSGIGLCLWELATCLHDSKPLSAETLARRGIAAPSPPKSQKSFGPPVAPLNNSRSDANRQGDKRNSHRLLRGIVWPHFHFPYARHASGRVARREAIDNLWLPVFHGCLPGGGGEESVTGHGQYQLPRM